MKIFGLLLSLILTQTCLAQFKLAKLDKSSIPKNLQYVGNIVQAVRWTDNTGDHIVILTMTDKLQSKNAPSLAQVCSQALSRAYLCLAIVKVLTLAALLILVSFNS